MEKITEVLQCPVCYNLPRAVPVQSCTAGHIVCQDCKLSVGFCPICRDILMNNTNTIAGNLIQIVLHNCKFNSMGCNVKLPLDEIKQHEKYCIERTVICPYREVVLTEVSFLNIFT